MKKYIILIATILLAPSTWAWDGVLSGTVSLYEIVITNAGQHNKDFRVYIQGATSYCVGGNQFAYINSDNVNYRPVMAAIMQAQATGKNITIYMTYDGAGCCQIGDVQVVS